MKSNIYYEEALLSAVPPMTFFGEASFLDNKPKASFKTHQVNMKTDLTQTKFTLDMETNLLKYSKGLDWVHMSKNAKASHWALYGFSKKLNVRIPAQA